jgi:hypothetical protein
LYPNLEPSLFVELLVESEFPVWHRWDGNVATLLEVLTDKSQQAFNPIAHPGATLRDQRIRWDRLLWSLDRLASTSDSNLFEQFLQHPMGVYAWSRRLPPERRSEIISLRVPVFESKERHASEKRRFLQALMLGWCDSCPDGQLQELLDWPEYWKPKLEFHDVCYLSSPIDEFHRRCNSAANGSEQMVAALRRNLELLNDSDLVTKELARKVSVELWMNLLKDAATENPASEDLPRRPENSTAWFYQELSTHPFSHLSGFARQLSLRRLQEEHIMKHFWIWRHGRDNWKNLLNYTSYCDEPKVFDRLAEIVPPDELAAWDGILGYRAENHGEITAFCKWISPQHVEALRLHFQHNDSDWRTCAFQNYLTKAPEIILKHLWDHAYNLPFWQAKLLDRRLFAPTSLRSPATVADIQAVEGDLRLRDPFNHRGI